MPRGEFLVYFYRQTELLPQNSAYRCCWVGLWEGMLVRHGSAWCGVRPPPLIPVYGLCLGFEAPGVRLFKIMWGEGGVIRFRLSEALEFGEGCLIFRLGERVAWPCGTRVRVMFFMRCPASALKCVGPGPLGDASGSLSLVLASVNVYLV